MTQYFRGIKRECGLCTGLLQYFIGVWG